MKQWLQKTALEIEHKNFSVNDGEVKKIVLSLKGAESDTEVQKR